MKGNETLAHAKDLAEEFLVRYRHLLNDDEIVLYEKIALENAMNREPTSEKT